MYTHRRTQINESKIWFFKETDKVLGPANKKKEDPN